MLKKLLILMLIIANIYSCASYQSTAKYKYKLEKVKEATDIAMKKIDYKLIKEVELKNDRNGFLYWQKYKFIEMKFKPLNENTFVQMTSGNDNVNHFVDDIITQELKKDYGKDQLKKKSFLLALILNSISPAIGHPYEEYQNPYYSKNKYLGSIFGGLLVEILSTWLFGIDFGRKKFNFKDAIKWRWLYPAVTIVISPIMYMRFDRYNNLVESGYSFRF